MTDASLMDADCIHGNTWWECQTCWDEVITDDELQGSDMGTEGVDAW